MSRFLHIAVVFGLILLSQSQSQLAQPRGEMPSVQEDEAVRLSKTAAELFDKGQFGEALPLAKRVVEIEKATFGIADARVTIAIQNLAEIYLALKEFGDAERSFREAIAIYEQNKIEILSAGVAFQRLASLEYRKHRIAAAIDLYERALPIFETNVGFDDLAVANLLWDLANVRSANGDFNLAQHLCLRALAIKEKQLGASSPDTVATMKGFACSGVIHAASATPPQSPLPADSEFSVEERSINARAICWAGQLSDDCGSIFATRLTSTSLTNGSIINGRATHLDVPPYPNLNRATRTEGAVYVAVLIDESGNVTNARGVCTSAEKSFLDAAVRAARKSTFTPTTIDWKPVQATGFIFYNFRRP